MTADKTDSGSLITECPRCHARYRIERAKLSAEGARLRCVRCQAAFRVALPAAPPAEPAPPPVLAPPVPAGPLVLVADPDPDLAKRNAAALGGLGLQPMVVHDGVEAILAIQRHAPVAVVLDAALPKMFGFQVCELVKRNQSLRQTHVILVAAARDQGRHSRPPSEGFGADAYVEPGELPGALAPLLARLGVLPPRPAPAERAAPRRAAAAAAPMPALRPTAAAPPATALPAARPAVAEVDPNLAKAERLARIVVSDIVLYNPEKFAAAIAAGEVASAMAEELAEGRKLFEQRVPLQLRKHRDFLIEELQRVARSRGMR